MAIENFHCVQSKYIIITLRLFAFLPLRVCILSEKSSLLKSGDFSLSFEMTRKRESLYPYTSFFHCEPAKQPWQSRL